MVLRCKQTQWQKKSFPLDISVKPTSYFDILTQIDEMDNAHILGRGSVKKILPLNKHWQEVSGFVTKNIAYVYAWAADESFKSEFNFNYICQVKKDVGFRGSDSAFLSKSNSAGAKFYLNNERKNSSALLIIHNDKFYLISPRVDW